MEPDCFYQVWSSDPVPEDRRPIFGPPCDDLDDDLDDHTKSGHSTEKSDQFEILTQMFIEICNEERMDMKRSNIENDEKILFDGIETFDQEVEKWNSVYPDDLHSFFLIRLLKVLEIRIDNYKSAVHKAIQISYSAETNYNESNIASIRAVFDSERAVKNASAILDAAISDMRIARTLLKK